MTTEQNTTESDDSDRVRVAGTNVETDVERIAQVVSSMHPAERDAFFDRYEIEPVGDDR